MSFKEVTGGVGMELGGGVLSRGWDSCPQPWEVGDALTTVCQALDQLNRAWISALESLC